MGEQFRVRGKPFVHLGTRAEMILAVEMFFRVLLAKQSQRADALDNIVLPTIGWEFIMNRQRGNAGQGSGSFLEGFDVTDLEIKTTWKKWGKRGAATQSQEASSIKIKVPLTPALSPGERENSCAGARAVPARSSPKC